MESGRRTAMWLGLAASALAALVLIAGLALPLRITYGAGSLRCGSVVAPDAELGDDCQRVADARVRLMVIGSVVVLATGAASGTVAIRRGAYSRATSVAVGAAAAVAAVVVPMTILSMLGARSLE